MPTQQPLILQAPQQPTPDMTTIGEFGLLGVTLFLNQNEGFGWFQRKEAAEDKLVATLVADLRATQKDLLEKLFELQLRQHEHLAAVRSELENISDKLDAIAAKK